MAAMLSPRASEVSRTPMETDAPLGGADDGAKKSTTAGGAATRATRLRHKAAQLGLAEVEGETGPELAYRHAALLLCCALGPADQPPLLAQGPAGNCTGAAVATYGRRDPLRGRQHSGAADAPACTSRAGCVARGRAEA